MSRKSYPNVNAANQYARDVVRGKIVACQFVIQACQRHLDDLMAEKSKSFRYRFDKDLAERAAKFIQLLPHTKGEWAFKRMPITLEPWQLFVICCAFGWVNKGTRLRRFREVYTEIPRKNGKSAISAGVALYCFACDNEFGAEVYSGATTEKQAWEVFRPARLMCKRTPMLTEAFGIEVNASNMNRPEDGARFEPLIGNPGDGSSPHCAVVDEYHEHATDALYTTMLTGMGARRQPLMWAITTAGYNIEGPCYDKRREVIEMLNGSVPNDELFGIIYTVDEGDDWTDPQVLEKANPNIGVSVYREFLLSQQQRAKNNARLANVFKTKHLNIWVSARSAYFNLVSWQSCEDKSLTLERFEGQPCILAFDLARKLDMNSMARLYTREIDGKTHYYSVAPRFWVLGENILSCDTEKSIRERFSVYQVAGQRAGNDNDFGEATTTALRARTEDAFIARYRPMYIRQTGQATGAGCIARADFEARQRAARTDETTYVVQGWRQGNGTLWQPNQRVIVFDPVCGFDNTELLVSEVTFTQDQNGTLTEIRVGPPDAYLPEPEDPGARKKKKARVQEDPF